MEVIREEFCERNLIPAYIDGELEVATQARFEKHLPNCQSCRAELRIHQQFMCELDAVMTNKVDVVIPANFSQVIAARALSDMSGVRSRTENKKALAFCLILGITGFALIGATTRQTTVTLARRFVGRILSVLDLAWHALYDLIAGVAVISRVLSRKFVIETGNLGVVLVLFAVAVLLLSRLIFSYHRTDAIE
jgi:predicted anti-sigma-YlaC factor YlaD